MTPTIGRIVLYTLSEHDAAAITHSRSLAHALANPVAEGQTYPAMVVRTFGGPAVNLRVFLDGDDTYWATSRVECTDPSGELADGKWHWPERV